LDKFSQDRIQGEGAAGAAAPSWWTNFSLKQSFFLDNNGPFLAKNGSLPPWKLTDFFF